MLGIMVHILARKSFQITWLRYQDIFNLFMTLEPYNQTINFGSFLSFVPVFK